MDVSDLLNGLNDKQREAVAAPRSNLLVLAGAGSGKTRVLVHRIAAVVGRELLALLNHGGDLHQQGGGGDAPPYRPADRYQPGGMWIGTFHGRRTVYCARTTDAGLPQDFQILDSEDQLRLLKRLIKAMNLDEKQWPARQGMWYINGKRTKGCGLSTSKATAIRWSRRGCAFTGVPEACDRAGLVDFAELLLRAHELWLNKPQILNHYRERFSNILVDEFRDTNNIQYAWIRMLAGESGRVIIVGDDDQSIYGWRGAQVENIQRFLQDFPARKPSVLSRTIAPPITF